MPRVVSCRSFLAFLTAFFVLAFHGSAHADTVIYNNLIGTSFSGSLAYSGSGSAQVNGALSSKLFAQAITPATGTAGLAVNTIYFTLGNYNSTAITINPTLEFFNADGANGGPGSIITRLSFGATTLAASFLSEYAITSANGFFTTPTSSFYAGVFFNDGGRGDVTAAQMNLLGTGLYSSPTTGSTTTNTLFTTTAAYGGAPSPAGTLATANGNIGFELVNTPPTAVTPEPSTLSLLGTGLAGLSLLRRRLRRA